MRSRPKIYRRYLAWMLLPFLLAMTIGCGCYLILLRLGEATSPQSAAEQQVDAPQLYGSDLFYRPAAFKIAKAGLRRSDLLIIGSSRVMEFVAAPFTVSATNAGGAAKDIDSMADFFAAILKGDYQPKVVLLGLDYWWFSQVDAEADERMAMATDIRLTAAELLKPFTWLANGQLSLRQASELLFTPSRLPPGIGLDAKFGYAGWSSFGDYDYGRRLARLGPDRDFKATMHDLTKKKNGYRRLDSGFSQEKWDRFSHLLADLQARHIAVIVMVPPVAPAIADWIAGQPQPNVLTDLRSHLRDLSVPVFDFHDMRQIDSNACEFLDGFHAGNVTDLRLLQEMSLAPQAPLHAVVDEAIVSKLIAGNAAHATLRESRLDPQPETDFLGIGCKK